MTELELRHYGVKGQRWGIRRFQNKDGSLTAAGRKRLNEGDRDAEKLTRKFEKYTDNRNAVARSTKRTYPVDEHGNNRYTDDGKGYFDPNAGLVTYNRKVKRAATKSAKQAEALTKKLKQKYDDVKIEGTHDLNTGKAFVRVQLEKNGQTYISEIKKDYGSFETPVEFVTYKKEK